MEVAGAVLRSNTRHFNGARSLNVEQGLKETYTRYDMRSPFWSIGAIIPLALSKFECWFFMMMHLILLYLDHADLFDVEYFLGTSDPWKVPHTPSYTHPNPYG